MSVIQTLLVYVGIPLLVVLLVGLAVYGRSAVRQPNRYRPGRPWPYPTAWYVPHPDAVSDVVPEVTGGQLVIEGATSATVAVGGATGEW